MISVTVRDERDNIIESRSFRGHDRMTDYVSDVVGCKLEAAKVHIKSGEREEVIDCWQLRDRAVVNGYELPVHREMLARA